MRPSQPAALSLPANPRQPIHVSQSTSANPRHDDRIHLPPLLALAPPAPVTESRPTPAPLLPPGSFTHPDHHNLISVISIRISHPATLPKLISQPAFSKVPIDDDAQTETWEHFIFAVGRILLRAEYCCGQNIAVGRILLRAEYCCGQNIAAGRILMLRGIKFYCSIRSISTAGLESMPGLRRDSLPQTSIEFDLANAFQSECIALQYLSNPE